MTWFKVDDRLHAHPKALATSLAALGLWTVAGSWSSDHLTDGFMPDHVIPLLSRGASELADELVAAGLWRRVRGGYLFHQWHNDGDGSRRNPTKKEVEDLRRVRADAGRKGGLTSGKTRSKPPSKREANAKAKSKHAGLNPRPVPIDSSQSTRLEVTHEDDELSTGSVPGETWEHYARLKLGQQTGVRNPQPWLAKCRRNAEHELAEQAERWWATFEVDPYRLAQALVDGHPPRNVPRRQEAS